jgi:uncharacterized membrane protein (UPF0127 family)
MNLLQSFSKSLREFLNPRWPAEPDIRMQAINITRGTELATRLEVAGSGNKRNKGLLGRSSLPPGEGLWIVPCESVHTFFMRFPIDLIYIDRQNRIRKVRSSVGAWRLSACFSAHSVLELPAGTIRDTGTKRGDRVDFRPQNPNTTA